MRHKRIMILKETFEFRNMKIILFFQLIQIKNIKTIDTEQLLG